MINPYYFFDENFKIGFKINLESHNNIHTISLLNIVPNFPDIGIETSYFNETIKEMATIYARLLSQCKFKYHIFLQQAFIRLMKKIKEVMKLNYSIIRILTII